MDWNIGKFKFIETYPSIWMKSILQLEFNRFVSYTLSIIDVIFNLVRYTIY